MRPQDVTHLEQAMDTLSRIERQATAEAWDAPSAAGEDGPHAQDFGRLAEAASVARDAVENVFTVAAVLVGDEAAKARAG